MHLRDCCSDFGSIYAFWCFAFERCNGVLGSFQTNNRCIESQIMKKFIFQQQIFKLQFPTEFQDISDLLSLNSQGKGSLKVEEVDPAITIKLNALSHFRLEELHSAYNDSLFLNQARAGRWPARAWFIEITSVRMYVCVCVCVSAPEAMNN